MSDGPALEGRPGVALDLYELVLLSLWSLNVGHLHKEVGCIKPELRVRSNRNSERIEEVKQFHECGMRTC